jgi:hypothetical protein
VIDHDPEEFRRPVRLAIWTARIQIFVLVGIAFGVTVYYRMRENEVVDWRNVAFALLWLCLLAWAISPRVPLMDAEGHESAGQRLAFRLGKKLHKILHLRRRNTAVRD